MDLSQIPDGAQGQSGQNPQDEAAKKAQEEQMRRDMMATVLDNGARERCMFYSFTFQLGFDLVCSIPHLPRQPRTF